LVFIFKLIKLVFLQGLDLSLVKLVWEKIVMRVIVMSRLPMQKTTYFSAWMNATLSIQKFKQTLHFNGVKHKNFLMIFIKKLKVLGIRLEIVAICL